jgi:hypothetical protein
MRTTITLDPDVEKLLRDVIRERDLTFKEAVNEAIRAGLKTKPVAKQRYRQKSFSMGAEKLFPWEKALQIAASLEDEELVRKMALRK